MEYFPQTEVATDAEAEFEAAQAVPEGTTTAATDENEDVEAAIAAEEQRLLFEDRRAGKEGAAGAEYSDTRIGQTLQNLWDRVPGWTGFWDEQLAEWPDLPSKEEVAKREGEQLAAKTRAGAGYPAQLISKQNERFLKLGVDPYGGGVEPVGIDAAFMTFVADKFPETYKYALSQRLANFYNKKHGQVFDPKVFDVRYLEDTITYRDPLEDKRKLFIPRGSIGRAIQQELVEQTPVVGGIGGAVAGSPLGGFGVVLGGFLGAGLSDWWKSDVGLTTAGFKYTNNGDKTYRATEDSDPEGVFAGFDFGVFEHPETGAKVSGLQVLVDSVGEGVLFASLQVGGNLAVAGLRNTISSLGAKALGGEVVVSAEFLRSIDSKQFLKALEHYKQKQARGDLLPYGKLGESEGPTTSQVFQTMAEEATNAGRLEEAAALTEQAARAGRFESELAQTRMIHEAQERRAANLLGDKGETGIATSPRFKVMPDKKPGSYIIRDTQTQEIIEAPWKSLDRLQREADRLNAEMGYPITALEREAAALKAGESIQERGQQAALLDPLLVEAQNELAVVQQQAEAAWQTVATAPAAEGVLKIVLPQLRGLSEAARKSTDVLFDNVKNAFTKQNKTTLARVPEEFNWFDLKPIFQGKKALTQTNQKNLLINLDKAISGELAASAVERKSFDMVKAALTDEVTTVAGKTKRIPKRITYGEMNDTLTGINRLFQNKVFSTPGPAKKYLTKLRQGLVEIRDKRLQTIDDANVSPADLKMGKGLLSNLKVAETAWANYDYLWRNSTLSSLRKFGKESGYTAEKAVEDFFPEGNIPLQETIVKAVIDSENLPRIEALRNLFRYKLQNSVLEPVETGPKVAGITEIAQDVVGIVTPKTQGLFLNAHEGVINKLFTPEEIQSFRNVGTLSKAAQQQAEKTAALQKAAEKAGVELTNANILGVEGLVEPMMGKGGANFINSMRSIIFRNTKDDPAALQAARQEWDSVRYAGAERMIFGEADLTAVGTLERISNPGAILKNLDKFRGPFAALVGKEQAKNVRQFLNYFKTAFSDLRRSAGKAPEPKYQIVSTVVGTIIKPIVGVLNRRAVTATAARNLITMELAKTYRMALLNPNATANWIKIMRMLKRGEDAAVLAGAALGYDLLDEKGEAFRTVLDSVKTGPWYEEVYTQSPEEQKKQGVEVRRGPSPAPAPPLSFLKEWDTKLRKAYPPLDDLSRFLQTRPQDQPPPQAAPQQAAPQAATGIGSLGVPTASGVLRQRALNQLTGAPFNKGGIVNARRPRQIVL